MSRQLFYLSLLFFFYVIPVNSAANPENHPGAQRYIKRPIAEAALYKYIVPRSLNRNTDLHDITIVVPDDIQWKQLGTDLAGLIKGRWKISARVSLPESLKFSNGWKGNTILLGNLGNNTQMARLYGLRLSYADGIYPGAGGYQLATLIDPFGAGGNTVIIGASDIRGAQKGVDQLKQILIQQAGPSIPWVLKCNLSKETAAYFPTSGSDEQTARRLLNSIKPIKNNETVANSLIAVLSEIKQYGEYYQLTANPAFGRLYSLLLKEYTMFVNQFPEEAKNQLESRRNMWIQGEKLFQQWSVLEADPLFTQLNRSQILSALYLTCEANASDGYLHTAPKTGARWNHEIFPALSLAGSCSYFEKYYKMPEISVWKKMADQIFSGNTSYISLDEGSDYLVHVPMINIDYAMATGNRTVMNRSLRPSADLHAMMIDNLGTLSGGGDIYPFGMSSAYSWGHSQVMNAAAWYFKDPVYQFLLERTRTGPFSGQKMPDLNYPIHRYVVSAGNEPRLLKNGYPRVSAQSVEGGVYNDLLEKEHTDVPQSMTFHKLAFRSGFGTDDSYLIVDGFSAGRHGHQDGNSILNYSANGRLFLNDRDYIQNTPEHHSGIVIIKDGEQLKKPPLARLNWVADLDGSTFSNSEVPGYNHTDWFRTIISPTGTFFIIFDDLKFQQDGNFLVKNLWQSLGTPQRQQNKFNVEQKGVSMLIESMAPAKLGFKDIYGHFIKYWKSVYPYPFADREAVLSQVLPEKKYSAGDRVGFVNVLSSYKNSGKPVRTTRINRQTIAVVDGKNSWLAIKGAINSKNFNSNGSFHLWGNGELTAANVTSVTAASQTLTFAEPVFFKMNGRTGKWTTYSLVKDKIRYDKLGNPVKTLALDSGRIQLGDKFIKELEVSLTRPDTLPSFTALDTGSTHTASEEWKKIYHFNEPVSSSAYGDLNNDGKDELLLGGTTGTLTAIDQTGKEIWSFKTKGRINEVSVQQAGSKKIVFVATENWYVHALDTHGNELWNHKFPDDPAHSEFKGNLIGITNVRIAYPEGRQSEPSVMVGTQFRYVYRLDIKGNVTDQFMLYFYGIEDMEYADLDGDGREEGMFGLEYFYYTLLNNNKQFQGKTGGPGWKVVDVFNRDAKQSSMLLGSKQGEVRMIDFDTKLKELWVRNVGGEVNDITNGDFDGDGVPEILVASEGFQFYVLDKTGKTVFRRTLNDRVLKVAGLSKNGEAAYLAAVAGGSVCRFSTNGKVEKDFKFSDEISNILVTNSGTIPWVVLANGSLFKMN